MRGYLVWYFMVTFSANFTCKDEWSLRNAYIENWIFQEIYYVFVYQTFKVTKKDSIIPGIAILLES